MFVLLDFCTCNPLLLWLLSGLLGLGLGWLLWGRLKAIISDLEAKIRNLESQITSLNADLENCKKLRMEAEGNVSLLKGRISEFESKAKVVAAPVTTTASVDVSAYKRRIAELEEDLDECRERHASDSSILRGQIRGYEDEKFGIATSITDTTNISSSISDTTTKSGDSDAFFAAIGTDRLQIIEGVGPKMDEVLRTNGYSNFASIASATPEQLRAVLDKYDDKYRIIDPTTWPKQAKLANERAWNQLIDLQKALDTGRSDVATDGETDSKLEKYLVKIGLLKKWAQDDLKAVEGIGPKIEGLLHNAGIKTWRQLAETSSDRIKHILDSAGSSFQLADPTTWPKQAGMAADGKWDELKAYQDFLNAGKEK
ncbi:MAG: helix-hairpin-helix domain-containing protein [Saprospiraceae bacterium]